MANVTQFLGNIRGHQGPQGQPGLQGLPGMADAPTDDVFAAYLAADDTETYASAEVSLRSFFKNIYNGHEMALRWRAAVDRVLTLGGPAKALCIGDSTTAGTGSSGSYSNLFSYPSEMARAMNQHLALTTYGLSIPPSNNQPASDPRWVLGSGWVQATEVGVGLGGRNAAYKSDAGGSGTLTFLDPRINANRYDIYYTSGPSSSSGTFTAQSGTGTPVVVNTQQPGSGVIRKVTVTGPTSNSVGVTIQNTGTAGTVWILAIEPYATGESRFRVGNAGVAASSTAGWLAGRTDGNVWNVLSFLPAYEPDLVIIDLGINDAGEGVSATDYVNRIQTLADAAYAAGAAVLIKTMIPSDGTRATLEAQYVAALKTGLSPRYAILDLFTHYGTWERTNARGWMDDWGHGNDLLYADEGAIAAEMLFRYSGHGG